jgi:GDP/UDP-N,N'-diacetylbacillosamine 2-epimerase (hydrolysing)
VAHLHGGETTEGAFDEAIRHSITKMSHLHFVAAEEYRNRVIQLGEYPDRVFCVGGLGIDNILKLDLLSKRELEKSLDFELGDRNLLVTFHPVTLADEASCKQMKELLDALDEIKNTRIIFTMPNADTDGRSLFRMIEGFANSRIHAKAFTSLGQLRYLSCIKHIDAVLGNSSSGLIEVPSFRKPTINIGARQEGRLKADSVIDCKPEKGEILKAVERSLSEDFQSKLESVRNPYGNGGASKKIVEIISSIDLHSLIKKQFYDL